MPTNRLLANRCMGYIVNKFQLVQIGVRDIPNEQV